MISRSSRNGDRPNLDTLEKLPVHGLVPAEWATDEFELTLPPDSDPDFDDMRIVVGGARATISFWRSSWALSQTLEVVFTPCRYGGFRPWWVCRGCGKRRGVLFDCNHQFRCRGCIGGYYGSQRSTWVCRRLDRLRRFHKAAGGSGRLLDPLPMKPKGMHRRRFLELREGLRCEVTELVDAYAAAHGCRRDPVTGRLDKPSVEVVDLGARTREMVPWDQLSKRLNAKQPT